MSIPFNYDQQDWGSVTRYPDGSRGPWNPDKWIIHWGGGANRAGWPDSTVEDEMAVLRGWQRYHMRTRGWTDIAYNWAVGNATGSVYRLRGENRSGATSGDVEPDGIPENFEARAVVWIGGEGQTPSPRAYQAMQFLIDSDPLPVIVHRDVKATQCPGNDWTEWVRGLGGNLVALTETWAALVDLGLIAGDPEYYSSGAATEEEIDHALAVAIRELNKRATESTGPLDFTTEKIEVVKEIRVL